MELVRPDKNWGGFYGLSTSTISDALDRFGIRGGCEGDRSVFPGQRWQAPPSRFAMSPSARSKNVGDYIDDVQGRRRDRPRQPRTNGLHGLGRHLTITAKLKHISGTVIEGSAGTSRISSRRTIPSLPGAGS